MCVALHTWYLEFKGPGENPHKEWVFQIHPNSCSHLSLYDMHWQSTNPSNTQLPTFSTPSPKEPKVARKHTHTHLWPLISNGHPTLSLFHNFSLFLSKLLNTHYWTPNLPNDLYSLYHKPERRWSSFTLSKANTSPLVGLIHFCNSLSSFWHHSLTPLYWIISSNIQTHTCIF